MNNIKKSSSNILVTGGAGYIGSHTCKALAQAGYMPITYDNLVHGHRWAVQWGPLEVGDLSDRQKLDAVIEKFHPEAVIHFAAYAYVGESIENPGKYYRNNIGGTLNILDAMRDHGIFNIVFSSTCSTYGIPKSLPIPEDHPQNPINPYGASKLMVERILKDFAYAHGIHYASLRYFNAAGADPDAQIGEDHAPETHLIPLVLDVALGKRNNIKVFGTDYETPDGTCIRDYIHVTDLAEAHLLALDYLRSNEKSNVFNLGNEKGFSVRNVIETAKKITQKEINALDWTRRPGDPPVLVGSSNKAKKVLGWTPVYNDLELIIKTAWKWHRR